MRRIGLVILTLVLIAAACGNDTESGDTGADPVPSVDQDRPVGSDLDRRPADPDAPAAQWVAGVNAAGWRLHRSLPEGNKVSSPISIGTAFSFARAGASVDSGAALDKIFGFPTGDDAHAAANAVAAGLAEADTGTTTLEIANRLFPDIGFVPNQEFVDVGAEYYGSAVQPVDTGDGEAAAREINGWVNDRTRGLIPGIVTPEVVRDNKLFLVNTVYLFAEWANPFLAGLTHEGDFTAADGSSVTAEFMTTHEPEPRRFVTWADADAVELPYADGDLAMWLIVPHEVDGLEVVEASLSADQIVDLSSRATEGLVQLTMPKWEQELPPYDLFEWLCPEGFCPGAGFDAISPGLFITDALHGARIIVDEKGTEAAAVTALAFTDSAGPVAELTVTADRPFLWAIVHEPSGSLVFVGHLTDPTVP